MNFAEIIRSLYKERDEKSNKSDFGRVLIIGGCLAYPNAVTIASEFALLAGPGFISLAVPKDIYPILASRTSETIIYENFITDENGSFLLKENLKKLDDVLLRYDSILIGNGIADTKENYQFLSHIIAQYSGNLIIDATGLKLLADYGNSVFKDKKPVSRILLTPHLGEAKNLFKATFTSREVSDFEELAKNYASKNDVYVLLKGHSSLLVTPQKESHPSSYPKVPALAKAGSGDGLAGFLAGLLAYGLSKVNYVDLIMFADQIIHLAALQAQQDLTPGLASILDVSLYLKLIINEESEDED